MGKAIEDGDAKTLREGLPGYDGDGAGTATEGLIAASQQATYLFI